MGISLDWQRKLGYRKDPFVDEPTADVVGLDELREKTSLFLLKDQRLGIVRGDDGMGKSSYVQWLRKELKGQRPVLVAEMKELTSREKLERFLEERTRPLYKRLFKDERSAEERLEDLKRHLQRSMVLVVEDARLLNSAHASLLDELLKETRLQSILVDEELKNPLSSAASLQATIPSYSDDELHEILKRRIEAAGSVGIFPLEGSFKKLAKKAKGNPRTLLSAAKEEAMERSLKDPALPEKPKERPTHEEEKHAKESSLPKHEERRKEKALTKEEMISAAAPKKKGFSLFGMRFELSDDEEPVEKKERKKEEYSHELSEETQLDAAELEKIFDSMKGEK